MALFRCGAKTYELQRIAYWADQNNGSSRTYTTTANYPVVVVYANSNTVTINGTYDTDVNSPFSGYIARIYSNVQSGAVIKANTNPGYNNHNGLSIYALVG